MVRDTSITPSYTEEKILPGFDYNPPLVPGENSIIFRVITTKDEPCMFQGNIRFPDQHVRLAC